MSRRDGFYDVVNPTGGTEADVNDRDRFFVRGQLLFEPNDALSFRLIARLFRRATNPAAAPSISTARPSRTIGDLNDPACRAPGRRRPADGNNIINVLRDLGQPLVAVQRSLQPRTSTSAPGRTYRRRDRGLGHLARGRTGISAAPT